jgi:hypothetical protein
LTYSSKVLQLTAPNRGETIYSRIALYATALRLADTEAIFRQSGKAGSSPQIADPAALAIARTDREARALLGC